MIGKSGIAKVLDVPRSAAQAEGGCVGPRTSYPNNQAADLQARIRSILNSRWAPPYSPERGRMAAVSCKGKSNHRPHSGLQKLWSFGCEHEKTVFVAEFTVCSLFR